MASTRLDVARRKLGAEIGPYGVFTALSGSSTTVAWTAPFESSVMPSDALAYQWVYAPASSIPRLRRVTQQGLNNGSGILTLDGAMGTAFSAGAVFEVSAKLPPGRDIPIGTAAQAMAMNLGINECLLLGLRHILVPDDTLELALVTNQRDYSLATWAWLDRPDRLVEVRTLDAAGTTYRPTNKLWTLREGARGNTLHFHQPFRFASGSYVAKLDVLRPGDTLTKVGGVTWGSSSITQDSDEAPVDLANWLRVGKVFAYMALRARSRGETAALYDELYRAQLADARRSRYYDHTNDIDPSTGQPGPPPPAEAEAA